MPCNHCGSSVLLSDYYGPRCPICAREPDPYLIHRPVLHTDPRLKSPLLSGHTFPARYCGPYPFLRDKVVPVRLVLGNADRRGHQPLLMQPYCPFVGGAHADGVLMQKVPYGQKGKLCNGWISIRFECREGHRLSLLSEDERTEWKWV